MTASGANAKAMLRDQVRARLKSISAADRSRGSAQLCSRFTDEPRLVDARTILFFAPMPTEPDIWPLLESALADGKTVALPAFVPGTNDYAARQILELARDLVTGRFGLREPAAACPEFPLNRLDLVLVPGVAFDPQGRRLGRGKGFYDRLLARVRGRTCGVAFDEQIVAAVPFEPHDVQLDCILTPTRLIET